MATSTTRLDFDEGAAPATPGASKVRIYAKADGLLYSKDDAGAETALGAGAGIAATIFDAKGDIIAATAADTASRLAVGTNGQVLTAASGQATGLQWATPASGGTELLGITAYDPGSDTVNSTSSTSIVDVDATNLIVTFTAPASGNILVELSSLCEKSGASGNVMWGLREAAATIKEGRAVTSAAAITLVRLAVKFYLTGISAGAHTYKWSYRTSAGTCYIDSGPAYGQSIMEVWAMP